MKFDIDDAAALLERTPVILRAMLHELPPQWLGAPEHAGAWSARDVACHLADLEHDGWLPRARFILEHGTTAQLPGIERERFRSRYRGASMEIILGDFDRLRTNNLAALRQLPLDGPALLLTGRHGVFGDVRLGELLSSWVVHDLTHLTQISRALAVQYRDAVGPWKQILSVLSDRT